MSVKSLKELFLLGSSAVLLVLLVGFFIYMVNTENSKEKMVNILSDLTVQTEEQKETKKEFKSDLLERKKFKELRSKNPPEKEMRTGKKNPFKSNDKEGDNNKDGSNNEE